MNRSDINMTTPEGRLLSLALTRLEAIAPDQDHWKVLQMMEGDMTTMFRPTSSLVAAWGIRISVAQFTIIVQLVGGQMGKPTVQDDRKRIDVRFVKGMKFQEHGFVFEPDDTIELGKVLFIITRMSEAWFKNSFVRDPPPEKDFAREIIFRLGLHYERRWPCDEFWYTEGSSDDFMTRLVEYVGREKQIKPDLS